MLLVLCLLDVEQANVGIFPPYKPRKIRKIARTKMMMNYGRFEPCLEEKKEESNEGLIKQLQKYIWSQIVSRMN